MRIVVGLAGSIAAYKAPFVIRQLRAEGHEVKVVPSAAALKFITATTLAAVSGDEVHAGIFDDPRAVEHVSIAEWAQLVLVAPASADLLARVRTGQADDLLSATILTATCPVVLAPAMHSQMWLNAATQENVAVLKSRGIHIIEPDSGRLTGPDSGIGRFPDPERVVAEALSYARCEEKIFPPKTRLLITFGGTREPIDPVRFIANRSSGRQGIALANAARALGADVSAIVANVDQVAMDQLDRDVAIERVETAEQMYDAVWKQAGHAEVIIMCAAVADYRVEIPSAHKLKKDVEAQRRTLTLVPNRDILASLVEQRTRTDQLIVGFAAETGDDTTAFIEYGRQKARRKKADLLAVNDVSGGNVFGTASNHVAVMDASGEILADFSGSKDEVARELITLIAQKLRERVTD